MTSDLLYSTEELMEFYQQDKITFDDATANEGLYITVFVFLLVEGPMEDGRIAHNLADGVFQIDPADLHQSHIDAIFNRLDFEDIDTDDEDQLIPSVVTQLAVAIMEEDDDYTKDCLEFLVFRTRDLQAIIGKFIVRSESGGEISFTEITKDSELPEDHLPFITQTN